MASRRSSGKQGRRTNGKRSGLEDRVSKQLPAGTTYESERLPYPLLHHYTPDFVLPNGIRLEVKGFFTGDDRTKMKAVKKAHPELDIRFVFNDAKRPIRTGSKTTYADWCKKNGFPWCETKKGTKTRAETRIPETWIHGK